MANGARTRAGSRAAKDDPTPRDRLYDLVTRLPRPAKRALLLALDMALVPICLGLSLLLAGGPGLTAPQALIVGLSMLAVAFATALWLGLPRIKLNAYDQNGIVLTGIFAVATGLSGALATALLRPEAPMGAVLAIFTMSLGLSAIFARIAARQALLHIYRSGERRIRVLIYGAGQTGVQLAAALAMDKRLSAVAFVDDNPTLAGVTVSGLRIHPTREIARLVADEAIDRVVLAIPSVPRGQQTRIARGLRAYGVEVRIVPSFANLLDEGLAGAARPIDTTELLGRDGLGAAPRAVCGAYSGRVVMVTGAGGSIGSELCRQLLVCAPSRLVLLDHCEHALYQIHRELTEMAEGAVELTPALVNVTDRRAVDRALAEHAPAVILHAAAYKHVTMLERNLLVGVHNNVTGTDVLASAAVEAGVGRFVLISTDKAVRPTSAMGATKRLAEKIVQDLAARAPGTRFSMVRFGNVLGSSGSVLPLFQDQIARGGPVTVTHAEVTRYFMTIPEAARLVLASSQLDEGGQGDADVYVLDMGEAVPIVELARNLILRSGATVRDEANPDGDIEIVFTQLAKGEKMHEELFAGDGWQDTANPKIKRVPDAPLSRIEVAGILRDLRMAVETGDEAAARDVLWRRVGRTALPELLAEATAPPEGAGIS
ncbi:MAG: polysaccharide biosynthesis protein [Paracoccaceae bacterium]